MEELVDKTSSRGRGAPGRAVGDIKLAEKLKCVRMHFQTSTWPSRKIETALRRGREITRHIIAVKTGEQKKKKAKMNK